MFRALAPLTPKPAEIYLRPALKNPAVAHCRKIWERTYDRVYKLHNSITVARLNAADAFREALPPLDCYENIRDFITCVGYAMAAEIMIEGTGQELLLAAKVALTAEARCPKTQGKAES